MKRFLLLMGIVMFCGIYAAHAQISKGNVMVGGDISNFSFTLNDPKTFTMTIDPKAAWFIQDHVAIGGYLNFQLQTEKGAGSNINYGIGALGRYYIVDNSITVLRHTNFFLEGTVGIQGVNPAHGDNTNGLGLGFGPGIAYFVTPNIGLECLLKYNGIIGFGSSVTSSNLVLGVGFQIYLPGKKLKATMKGQ
ncbi:outer membrane beta-barrel protein [Flavitalea flava]